MENTELIPLFFLVLTIGYAWFLFWCRRGWKKTDFKTQPYSGLTKISVVVAMRNESNALPALLNSIIRQDYPSKFVEYIFIDDHSDDDSPNIVSRFFESQASYNVKVMQNDGAGKKSALSKGIKSAWNELILTTDADCILPPAWISSVVSFFEAKNPVLIAMPVAIIAEPAWIVTLQQLETAGLSAIAGGSLANGKPMMCNGANLAFTRTAWIKHMEGQYSGKASGDDTDLLGKLFEHFPDRVFYFSGTAACVQTKAESTIQDFFRQRHRWASKISGTMSPFTVRIAILAWLVHFGLLLQLIGIWKWEFSISLFILQWIIKAFSEAMLINVVLDKQGAKRADKTVLFLQPFYWMYIILTGIAGVFFRFKWKGRKTV